MERYLADELGQRDRFTRIVEPVGFRGRAGQTLGQPDPLLGKIWNHEDWPAWRATLPWGRVAGKQPLVLSSDGRALAESAFDMAELHAHPLVSGRRLARARNIEGHLMVLAGPWWTGWYHWMLDLLPRAALLPLDDPSAKVLVPPRLTGVQDETLRRVGVPKERRVTFSGGQVRAEELTFPSFVGPTGNVPRWALTWLRDKLVPTPVERGRRIYVSRADAFERRVTNERGLAALLGERGFETVVPGQLDLQAQLRAFAEADVVVGPHGAGMTNLVAATNATVLELHREGMVRPCYFAQCNALGLPYWYLLCRPSGAGDMEVDLNLLERTLDAMLPSG